MCDIIDSKFQKLCPIETPPLSNSQTLHKYCSKRMTKCKELHDVAYRLLESHTISNMASLLGVSRKTIQRWKMPPQQDEGVARPGAQTGSEEAERHPVPHVG